MNIYGIEISNDAFEMVLEEIKSFKILYNREAERILSRDEKDEKEAREAEKVATQSTIIAWIYFFLIDQLQILQKDIPY